jgi:hypothetical protein
VNLLSLVSRLLRRAASTAEQPLPIYRMIDRGWRPEPEDPTIFLGHRWASPVAIGGNLQVEAFPEPCECICHKRVCSKCHV